MGHFRQRLLAKGKPDLVLDVGLMVILPKEGADKERYGIVTLDGAWETLEEDRGAWPEDQEKAN